MLNPKEFYKDLYVFLSIYSNNARNPFRYTENDAASEKCNADFGSFWADDALNKTFKIHRRPPVSSEQQQLPESPCTSIGIQLQLLRPGGLCEGTGGGDVD